MHAIGYSYVTNYCYIFVVDMQLQDRCLYCEANFVCPESPRPEYNCRWVRIFMATTADSLLINFMLL